ncbi:MAG: hypothetical protein K2H68_01485, partial [Bacteroidales bacterium]|nr:hypothetical protein [Bacteroidales bacterium]
MDSNHGNNFIKNYIAWGAAVAFAAFCLLYALPALEHQGHITFFCYLPEFVRPFFDGLFSHTQASVSQGIVATNGILSNAELWAGTSPNALQPRIAEFLWRFVSQFYLNKPLALLAAMGVTTLFLLSCRTISRVYTLLLLPLFLYFFTQPEPLHAAVAIALLVDMAALSVAARLLRTKIHPLAFSCILFVITILCFVIGGKWALLFVAGFVLILVATGRVNTKTFVGGLIALLLATLPAWNVAYTPAFAYPPYVWAMVALFIIGMGLGVFDRHEARLFMPFLGLALAMGVILHQTPLERTLLKAQNAIAQGNYARSLQLCERYYEKYHPAQDELKEENTAALRFTLAACLKLSLLQKGELCSRFLDYSNYYEMNLMYPADLPFRYTCAWPYIKTYDALRLYAPQVPFIFAYTEKVGYQNRLMLPMLAAECGTQQIRLAKITERYVRRTLHGKMPDCSSDSVDGARPVPVSSPELVRGGTTLDEWVRIYGARRMEEGAVLERGLLDYYTLLLLLDKDLGAMPAVVKAYAACGAPSLPVYVQEALCIWCMEQGENPQTILRRDFDGFHIN